MKKVGIVGYCVKTGLGYLVYDCKRFLPIVSHYVVPHPVLGIDRTMLGNNCVGNEVNIKEWLETVDCVITFETEYFSNFYKLCRMMGKKVICVVDIDWFYPKLEMWKYVDVFVAPNMYSLEQLKNYGFSNAVYIPASVDTDYFKFMINSNGDLAETFLFNNGWGGVENRKGLNEVVKLFTMLPNIVLILNTQRLVDVKVSNIIVRNKNYDSRIDLYCYGDVYLAPSKWEGYGLHILEAMSCGFPVITTDAPPMNEYVTDKRFSVKVQKSNRIVSGRMYTICNIIDFDDFKNKVLSCYCKRLMDVSLRNREIVEKNYSWKVNLEKWLELIDKL